MEAELEEDEEGQEWSVGLARVQEEQGDEVVMVHCPSPNPSSPPALRVPCLPTSSPPSYSKAESIIIFEEQDSDDEDEIKDYMCDAEADSANSESPASQGREEGRARRDGERGDSMDSDQEEELAAGLGKARVTAEDTISDESGYSEEPQQEIGKEVTVVRVTVQGETPETPQIEWQGTREEEEEEGQHKLEIRLQGGEEEQVTITGRDGVRWSLPISVETGLSSSETSRDVSPSPLSSSPFSSPPSYHSSPSSSPLQIPSPTTSPRISPLPSPRNEVSTSPRATDLSVKSVLLSEFSSTDKNRYIERSALKTTKSAMVLNRQEFCINI